MTDIEYKIDRLFEELGYLQDRVFFLEAKVERLEQENDTPPHQG